jgi:hypothetical protein
MHPMLEDGIGIYRAAHLAVRLMTQALWPWGKDWKEDKRLVRHPAAFCGEFHSKQTFTYF